MLADVSRVNPGNHEKTVHDVGSLQAHGSRDTFPQFKGGGNLAGGQGGRASAVYDGK